MTFVPKDSQFAQRVGESFARQHFMNFINAKLNRVEPGFCQLEVPYSMNISQQHGFFHAGIIGTMADNAAGYAAYSLMDSSSSILTVEFKLNLLSPADGDAIIAEAYVLKYGRTLTVCRSDVFILKQGVRKLCAASQSTLIELINHADKK